MGAQIKKEVCSWARLLVRYFNPVPSLHIGV